MRKLTFTTKSNTMDYSEFVSCILNKKKQVTRDELFYCFSSFDIDFSGFITSSDL